MVTILKTLGDRSDVGAVRRELDDDHMHMVLIVDGGRRLLTTITRSDLRTSIPDSTEAISVGRLAGRTTRPSTPIIDITARLNRSGERRLAVTDDQGRMLGLLCLKRDRTGTAATTVSPHGRMSMDGYAADELTVAIAVGQEQRPRAHLARRSHGSDCRGRSADPTPADYRTAADSFRLRAASSSYLVGEWVTEAATVGAGSSWQRLSNPYRLATGCMSRQNEYWKLFLDCSARFALDFRTARSGQLISSISKRPADPACSLPLIYRYADNRYPKPSLG
ncbi:CBS domain-containing protein [Williamsia soli]|uniref:CBS domain-containing protein n=1 Tax=Williamsia soli TaxID=364929 RepID=UPI001A9FA2CC|nr:CBS domain-containing protein [Williamsia soli]